MNWDKERPTSPNRDIFRQHGMMMAEVKKIQDRQDEFDGRLLVIEHQNQILIPRARASLRAPAAQSTGIAFLVSSTMVVIFETLRALGVLR